MAKILAVVATLFNFNRNPKGKQPRQGVAVRAAISSTYTAQSFADILSKYMEGGENGK